MKKTTILLIIFILIPISVLSWDDCPKGEVECEGTCGLFIDTDGDGICDLSQPAPEDRNKSIEDVGSDISATSNVGAENSEVDTKTNLLQKRKAIYHLIPITIATLLLYGLSLFFVKINVINTIGHRKIWNFLLLITFLVSGILGVLLVIKINTGWDIIPHRWGLFWHVEFGIAMTVISIFHIFWHVNYFRNMIKFNK